MKQVIVMAAGLGSRLKELTTETPKPLLKVNGKSMLETNIEYMIEAGIDRVIIIVGYLKEKFYYLKDKYKEQKNMLLMSNMQILILSVLCIVPVHFLSVIAILSQQIIFSCSTSIRNIKRIIVFIYSVLISILKRKSGLLNWITI